MPWGDTEFQSFLERYHESSVTLVALSDFKTQLRELFAKPPNRDLRKKPLFVARAAELVLKGVSFNEKQDLLDQLAAAYLERERSEKLLDKSGNSLVTSQQLFDLVVLIADEMWAQETRELDTRSIREVADAVFADTTVSPTAKDTIMSRIPFMAFLRQGRHANRIEFEHEVFFAYFLARTFAEAIDRSVTSLRSILARSVLPPGLSDMAAREISRRGINAVKISTMLVDAAQTDISRAGQVRENSGSLLSGCLRTLPADLWPRGSSILGLVFAGEDWRGLRIHEWKFRQCEFRRVDFTNTRFDKCSAEQTILVDVMIDTGSTVLDIDILAPVDVYGLRYRTDTGAVDVAFEPRKMRQLLRLCQLPAASSGETEGRRIRPEVVALLEKLMSAYDRSNVFWPEDTKSSRITGDALWPEVFRILKSSRVVQEERRDNKGQPRRCLRRNFLPEQIMAGLDRQAFVPDSIRQFWDALDIALPSTT